MNDHEELLSAIQSMLSSSIDDEVLDVVLAEQKLVDFLEKSNMPQLEIDSAWALANVASDHPRAHHFIDVKAISQLVDLLASADHDVRENAVRVMGNIVSATTLCKLAIEEGSVNKLVGLFHSTTSTQFQLDIMRTLFHRYMLPKQLSDFHERSRSHLQWCRQTT